MPELPYAESAAQNAPPIRAALATYLNQSRAVLEIASGTGQHAVAFARAFPGSTWQPTELPANLTGITLWREEVGSPNLRPPLGLDLSDEAWEPPAGHAYDTIFNANTLHIVSWPRVENLFRIAGRLLPPGGLLLLYGPFHYDGRPTSASNAEFDAYLRARDPESGVRDFEAVRALAEARGFRLIHDHAMPANNRLLAWGRPWS